MNRRPISIEIRLDFGDLRRWQDHVVATLVATVGVTLHVVHAARREPRPSGVDLLFTLERLVSRGGGESAVDRLDPAGLARFTAAPGPVDLVVDLVGDAEAPPTGLFLRLRCDDAPPLDGAVAAIVDDRTPVLTAELTAAGSTRLVARWPVAIENRLDASRSASLVMGRLAHLALTAVDALRRAADPATIDLHVAGEIEALPTLHAGPVGFFAKALTARIARRLARLVGRAPNWSVVWRDRTAGTDPHRPDLDPEPFRRILDDGRRFYADPFPWPEGDRIHLFCEEFPFATGRGIISLVTIEADGRVGPARPVIEQDCHLSYPFLFAHAGRMWMIPETSERRTVELWVADRFPDTWSRHSVLLDDTDVGDATLAEIDGTWWMFGASRERWCSSWEALHLWSAPAPTGPWTAHPMNPVVVDVRSARPAGHLFHTPEGWMRPVQNSSRGYGSSLGIAAIREIGPSTYREEVVRRFHAPPPLIGVHSWNQAMRPRGLFETIDIHGVPSKFGEVHRLDIA